MSVKRVIRCVDAARAYRRGFLEVCMRRRLGHWTILALACSVGASVVIACGGGTGTHNVSPSMGGTQGAQSVVAALGNNEQELRDFIDSATRAGKTPRYVTAKLANKSYLFSPYAQVLRTTSLLIVRGYNRMYVWSIAGANVYFNGASESQNLGVPLVSAPLLDRLAQSHIKLNSAGLSICSDCTLLFGQPNGGTGPPLWAGLKDPWQTNPDYGVWNDGVLLADATNPPAAASPKRRTQVSQKQCAQAADPAYANQQYNANLASGCYGFAVPATYIPPPGGNDGGGDPTPLKTPTPLPSGWTMGCNNKTRTSKQNELNTAMTASAPQMNASVTKHQEAVNFIARNAAGQYAFLPTIWQASADQGGQAGIGVPPEPPDGWTIVGFTHTHDINYGLTADPTGVDSSAAQALPYQNQPGQNWPEFTNTLFSVSDLEYANQWNLDAFVEIEGAQNSVAADNQSYTYYYGEWTAGGTVGQTTNYSSGSIGGSSTWNQCS